MSIAAHRVTSLQIVLDLRKRSIGIAVVDKRIELFHGFPDAHSAVVQRTVFAFFRKYEIESLVGMVFAIELAHDGRRRVVILAELFLGTIRVVAFPNVLIPIYDRHINRLPEW